MKVVLHDRTEALPPKLREYAQTKLTRLAHHFGRVAEADVEFSPERKRGGLTTVLCRINVHVDGRRTPLLSAHESGADPQASFDLAFDKIDRQVVKLKEKRTNRKKEASPVRVPQPETGDSERSTEPERIRMKLRPVSVEDAISELLADGQSFHVFLDEDSGLVEIAFRRTDGSIGIIEPVVP
ncbi:MAG: ribosome-associated translation inhibitor RaiA [Candidatus Dormibacteraeota bacterium]|nr:ribosome-associated translation inhibitor RaiA [Candidatus Dormibacteraeota bacterium]